MVRRDRSVLTVTLNPAIDVTYEVDAVTVGRAHRVRRVRRRAGGKGVNVARVLRELDVDVTAGILVGGRTGERIRSELEDALRVAPIELSDGESRLTVTVVDDAGDATLFNEPGPEVGPDVLHVLVEDLERRAGRHAVVVLAGSVPPGLPPTTYASLVGAARAGGARTILDTSDPWLRHGVAARPDVVTPNLAELREATGIRDTARAAAALRDAGAGVLAVSLGADGVLLDTPEGFWRTPAPEPLDGNATGAGDAAVAGIAWGLLHEADWGEVAALAVAAGTAATRRAVAGEIDVEAFRSYVAAPVGRRVH